MNAKHYLNNHLSNIQHKLSYLLGDKALGVVYFEGGGMKKIQLRLDLFRKFSCNVSHCFSVNFIKQHVNSNISNWK